MEIDKNKPMSILSDLDPKNARFPERSSSGKVSKAVWILALFPILAGAAWVTFSLQSGVAGGGETASAAVVTKQDRVDEPAVQPPISTSTSSATTPAVPTTSDRRTDGAAQILATTRPLEQEKSGKDAGGNVFQAMQRELDKPSSDTGKPLPDSQSVKTKTAKPKKPQESRKPGAIAAKANRSNEGTRTSRNPNKPAERDIDIITAIVR